ncbi:MAG TPA: glutathione S-transferase [Caldimonas sp.]|nr:glutathione S-transferase [Caldimonas sp.]HEX2541933.1 glutathione S-transferase [Caldimonas sp.]
MLTLYGSQGSGSASVEAALAVAGVACEHVDGAEWKRTEGYERLRQVNPLAQIPTLVLDDGSVLSESAAILIHLGLCHPHSGLLSPDPSRRAQQIRGLVYIAANCYAGIGILDYPDRWYPEPDEGVRKAMAQRGRARLHELWDVFADQFPATPWLSGERLGALDILAATVSMWSGARKHLAESRPAFSALLARIEADPRVAAVWAKHWPKAEGKAKA